MGVPVVRDSSHEDSSPGNITCEKMKVYLQTSTFQLGALVALAAAAPEAEPEAAANADPWYGYGYRGYGYRGYYRYLYTDYYRDLTQILQALWLLWLLRKEVC